MARYTHGHSEAVLEAHGARTAENSCGYFLDALKPGDSVLDIGCGPGSITIDLAQKVGSVIGVDQSEAAVTAASKLASDRGADNVEFRIGDVMDLDFPDDSFDVVHAHQVLQHLSDPVGALKEMARVCKPGGIIAVRDADYSGFTWFPASEGLSLWRDSYRQIASNNGGEPDAGRYMLQWALKAELEDPVITASTWTYASETERQWWARTWSARVQGEGYVSQLAAVGVSDPSVIVDAWTVWASDPAAWFVVPHGEMIVRMPDPGTGPGSES